MRGQEIGAGEAGRLLAGIAERGKPTRIGEDDPSPAVERERHCRRLREPVGHAPRLRRGWEILHARTFSNMPLRQVESFAA